MRQLTLATAGFERYGLRKNAHRLVVTCALANLFTVRRQLLRFQVA
jgi:hypothetical protein